MTVRKQLALVEPSVEHEHARELHEIRRLVGEQPKIADLVHSDLIRGLNDSQTGRAGMMSAEQVLMVLFIKQMNDFSYTLLAYHSLVALETYYKRCLHYMQLDPNPPILFPDSTRTSAAEQK